MTGDNKTVLHAGSGNVMGFAALNPSYALMRHATQRAGNLAREARSSVQPQLGNVSRAGRDIAAFDAFNDLGE
jgi:hypothetical protein